MQKRSNTFRESNALVWSNEKHISHTVNYQMNQGMPFIFSRAHYEWTVCWRLFKGLVVFFPLGMKRFWLLYLCSRLQRKKKGCLFSSFPIYATFSPPQRNPMSHPDQKWFSPRCSQLCVSPEWSHPPPRRRRPWRRSSSRSTASTSLMAWWDNWSREHELHKQKSRCNTYS